MRNLLILLIVLLIMLSSVIAYLSPSIFGHQADVIGVSIDSKIYSFQDLINSDYLTNRILPQSTISSFSHSSEEITVRSVDGNVKVLSEAINDNFNVNCEFRADSSGSYEILTNPGHTGYEVSLTVDNVETTVQDYIGSDAYCYSCELNEDSWCGGCKYDSVFLATDGPGGSHNAYMFVGAENPDWNLFDTSCSHNGCFPLADNYFDDNLKNQYSLEGKEISYVQDSWVGSTSFNYNGGKYERKVLICGGYEEPVDIYSQWDKVGVHMGPAYYEGEFVYYKMSRASVDGNSFPGCEYSFCARFNKNTNELVKGAVKHCRNEGSLNPCGLSGLNFEDVGTVVKGT